MVRPKKHLGQHFLRDENIAQKIIGFLNPDYPIVLEVGPGMGVLTKYLTGHDAWFMEIDPESVEYLKSRFPAIAGRVIRADFLKYDLAGFPPVVEPQYFAAPQPQCIAALPNHRPKFTVIGNFPYNISTQILFTVLAHRDRIPEVIGMFQKEVAERIASGPGKKSYGIISVLLQAYYDIDYLFTVDETVFYPPPKVKSAVIRLRRNATQKLDCDEEMFTRVVKTAFNQRRKTLRNALRPLLADYTPTGSPTLTGCLNLRAEQLSVKDFVSLAAEISTFAKTCSPDEKRTLAEKK